MRDKFIATREVIDKENATPIADLLKARNLMRVRYGIDLTEIVLSRETLDEIGSTTEAAAMMKYTKAADTIRLLQCMIEGANVVIEPTAAPHCVCLRRPSMDSEIEVAM